MGFDSTGSNQIARFLCEYSEEQGNDTQLTGRSRRHGDAPEAWHKAWKKAGKR